jgi:hypothetical protein
MIATIGSGGLGSEYLRIAKRVSKNRKQFVAQKIEEMAVRINSSLLTSVLLAEGFRTRSTPFETKDQLEDFARESRHWDILVAGKLFPAQASFVKFGRKLGAIIVLIRKEKGKIKKQRGVVIANGYKDLLESIGKTKLR